MEDEDVDSVKNISVPTVENYKVDGSLAVCNDTKSVITSEKTGDRLIEEDSSVVNEEERSIDRLKNAINHDVDRFNENEESSADLTSPSPKKVNGEVDKSEGFSSEESCDYDKSENAREDFTSEKGKEENNDSEKEKEEHNDSEKEKEESNDSEKEKEENNDSEKDATSSLIDSSKRKRSLSDRSDVSNNSESESDDGSTSDSSPVEFRGFKKRKIFESRAGKLLDLCEENTHIEVPINDVANEPEKPKLIELRRSARNASIARRQNSELIISTETKEESGDQLTEYAQYLGLQPTVKFKCGRCGEKHFQSMASLNTHQMVCCKTASNALAKQTKPPSDSNLSTNFRITRKVYLCSACGTYYENWKLFLHMRDMHKRHICLFCLGMFSVAERLAEHLLYQHNVHEKACKSPEEFLNLFKGSCYLTCCSCEKMFTERDDFYDHQCKDSVIASAPNWNDTATLTPKDIKELAQKCSFCGVKCGHFRTCPKVAHKFQQNAQPSSFTASTNPPNNNSSNISLEKYYVPVPVNVQKNWNPNNLNQEILKQALSLTHTEKEYYDVSSAASFCHVDIANDSDNQSSSSPEKAMVEKPNLDRKKCPKNENRKNSLRPQDTLESTTKDDQEEPQVDNSKQLPDHSNNVIVNSVSDESDNSDSRLNSSNCETQDEPVKIHNEEHTVQAIEGDNKVSAEEDDDVDMETTHDEKSLERLSDEKIETGKVNTENEVDETEIEDDKTRENSASLEGISTCYVKLDRLNANPASDCSGLSREEENSRNDCNSSTSSNSSNNSSNSSRNSLDADHDDARDTFATNESVTDPEKTKDSEKQKNPIENVSINEDEPVDNALDDSCLNNGEKLSLLSNEESCGNRFDSNKETIDKSDGNESEDSDKLSVDLCEDDRKETAEDDDSNCKDAAANSEMETNVGSDDKMETDGVTERIDEHGEGSGGDTTTGLDETNTENDVTMEESQSVSPPKDNCFQCDGVSIQLASEEVMAMALTLEDKMDSLSSQSVIKECVRTSCTTCSYCSHAVKIGVNGKQLAIHLLTEHRYMPVKNETIEDIIERLKKSLDELQDVWFNTDSYDSSDKACFVPYDHTYECFQCNYVANTHKDLFSHKRKVHQKTILYCSMCKENFYSYSELLCHMCPGLYDAAKDIQFRCCLCITDRIPSAFRLMVHLRKSHHTCDICLEIVDDQQKLSAHMVKHKLHHLCYRCGIAYRNKPDITKHLFWKHGTESVLCKKCLQKKWPHVYHFCVPPNAFICEECNLSFSKAVYLKVHKRFHNNNLPYTCNTCEQKFVSKKLLVKHGKVHETVTAEENVNGNSALYKSVDTEKGIEQNNVESNELLVNAPDESASTVQHTEASDKADEVSVKPHKKKSRRDKEKKVKPVVDVYDLPPLNLSSESDDTEDEKETRSVAMSNVDEKEKELCKLDGDFKTADHSNDSTLVEDKPTGVESEAKTTEIGPMESVTDNEENAQPVTVVDGIWDNFHSYKAELEKRENLDIANKQSILSQLDPALPPVLPKDAVLGDHDYCLPNNPDEKEGGCTEEIDVNSKSKSNEHSSSIDHDYCTQKNESIENNDTGAAVNLMNTSNQSENTETPPKRKQKSPKKKATKQHNNSSSSSDSSSDSDSSSCSCGTNCSCSSSSSNSSSSSSSDSDSSSSDGRNNSSNMSTNKREKKKERLKSKRKGEVAKPAEPLPPAEEPAVNVQVEPEEPLIKESDLETDETATDEEFYDQYPQMQANQILAEKRNQLMLLATVAPTVNNGTASPPVPNTNSSTNINLDQISSPKLEIVAPPVTTVQPQSQSKKKVKTKKRRKSSTLGMTSRNRSSNKQHSLTYDTPQPSTSFTTQWQQSGHGKKVANDISPVYALSPVQPTVLTVSTSVKATDHALSSPVTSQRQQSHHPSSSSDNSSSKRFSKRRRVRNKFYGYSSDEDGEHNQGQHPPTKWKKFSSVDGNVKQNVHHQQPQQFYSQPFQQPVNTVHTEYNHGYQHQASPAPPLPKIVQPAIRTTFDENQVNNTLIAKRAAMPTPVSSGTSSDSDADSDSDSNRLAINPPINTISITAAGMNAGTSEKDDKLYCYCQCPYDEVSEMIACDGIDCAIEWFHFECVGIMVPPKGKWYCPDCRKRRGLS